MTHCIGVLSKGEGGGAYVIIDICEDIIGDNIEDNIGDNVGDIGVLIVQEKGEVEREGVGSHH